MRRRIIRSILIHKLVYTVNVSIIILIISTGLTSIISAQTEKNSTEVLAQVEKYQDTWNTHNASALTLFFSEDADFIMGNLPLINGREGIKNSWRIYFNEQEPERRLTIDVISLRIIAPNVALINVETTTGGEDSQENFLTTRKARGTWIMHKQNGKWLIVAMRGMPTEEDQIIRSIHYPEIKFDGTFKPIGPPLETLSRTDLGKNCIVELKQQYKISGILSGSLEIDFRILVNGPCGEPPGKYNEEWIAFGLFRGTVDGMPKSGKFIYTANVKAGGDVEGKIIFGQGIEGGLSVKGNFKEGKLSYISHLDKAKAMD